MRTTTRKALPLADVTDTAVMNFTVGTGIRQMTTDGVVRDTENALASLLDGFTDYGIDEQVSGRWEFQSPTITDKGLGQLFVNNTGAQRVAGDVVMLDPANDSSVVLPNAANISSAKVGVVAETIAAAAVGRVSFSGFIRVKCAAGTVSRLQYLQTQNASALAVGTTYSQVGTFAIAVTGLDGSNTCLAALHSGTSSLEGGGTINGSLQVTGSLSVGPSSSTFWQHYQSGTFTLPSGGTGGGLRIDTTLGAAANNDILAAIYLNPTFVDNAHTGVQHSALYVNTGGIYVATGGIQIQGGGFAIGTTPNVNGAVAYIASTANAVATVAASLTLASTLVAQVNGDSLSGLLVSPTYNDNGHTGVLHYGVYSSVGFNYMANSLSIGTLSGPSGTSNYIGGGTITNTSGTAVVISSFNWTGTVQAGVNSDSLNAISLNGVFATGGHTGNPAYAIQITPVWLTSASSNQAGVYIAVPATTNTTGNYGILLSGAPANGVGNYIIYSTVGAYLSAAGIWTNAPSWANLKDNVVPVDPTERASLLDWLRDEYKPIRYRYIKSAQVEKCIHRQVGYECPEGCPRAVEVIHNPYTEDIAFDHFGYLLDDMPENIRRIVMHDSNGGISTKDTEGFLLVLVQELAIRIKDLESRIN